MMKMRLLALIMAGLMTGLAYGAPPPLAEPSAAGMWAQVFPDGRVGGWFLIFENNAVYEGAIAKMFIKPGEDPNPICTHCTGDQKNQPSLGLVIIKGMQRNGLVYEKGSILDPRDGQVYKAKMTLSPDGQQLIVRGYLGFRVVGAKSGMETPAKRRAAARSSAAKSAALLARFTDVGRDDDRIPANRSAREASGPISCRVEPRRHMPNLA